MQAALDELGVVYEYVNIRKDEVGRLRVREINNGYESVPTLVFPDGSTSTEPSRLELLAHLQRLELTKDPIVGAIRAKQPAWIRIVPWLGLLLILYGWVQHQPYIDIAGFLTLVFYFLMLFRK